MSYFDELTSAMVLLAGHPQTLFVGQSVYYGGQRAHASFRDVPMESRIEMPIAEDFTMGFCTGLSLAGYLPVLFLPRWDFLLMAANQLVTHLDKIPLMREFRPKVIIRTAVGGRKPLDPGHQHIGDYSIAFRWMFKTVRVVDLKNAAQVVPAYRVALEAECSTILVEYMELYG